MKEYESYILNIHEMINSGEPTNQSWTNVGKIFCKRNISLSYYDERYIGFWMIFNKDINNYKNWFFKMLYINFLSSF